MVDPNIPLTVNNNLDTATPIRQGQQDMLNNAMASEKILQQHYQSLDAREKSRLQSTIAGAVQLKSYLDNDDTEGAQNFLMQRRQSLQGRLGAGENIDTQETDAALQMLKSGDVEGLKSSISGLMAAGQVYGILDDPTGLGGATGVMVNRLIQEGSAKTAEEALQILKGGAGQAGKNEANIKSGTAANYANQSGTNISDLEYKPKITQADSRAGYQEEGFQSLPKIQRALQTAELKNEFLQQKISQVRQQGNVWNTGFTGSLLSAVPGKPAYDLKQNIETLIANAGFDTLQEMRDNSPTGGALGQVSERELSLLQSAAQNLLQSQSQEQFQQNLTLFEQQRARSFANMQAAYEQDYNRFGGQEDQYLPAPGESQTNKIIVTNGIDTFEIDAADLPAAEADGFKQK